MTRVCIGKHEDFYEEHLGKSRIYPARVAVRTILVPRSFNTTWQNDRLNSTETNITRRINVPLICGDSKPWERKVIDGIFSRSSPKSMDERLKKEKGKGRMNSESLSRNSWLIRTIAGHSVSKQDFNGRTFQSLERSALFLHPPVPFSNLLSSKSASEGRYYLGYQNLKISSRISLYLTLASF